MTDAGALNGGGSGMISAEERRWERPVVKLDYRDDVIRISCVFPRFSLSNPPAEKGRAAFRQEVGMSGAGFYSKSGRPLLPSFGRFVQIPPDAGFVLEVEKGAPEIFENVYIKPAREKIRDQEDGTFEFDKEAYGEDAFYPYEIAECGAPVYMDGYRAVCLHVRPLQYNPLRRSLRFYRHIEVKMVLTPEETTGGSDLDMEGLNIGAAWDPSRDLEGFGALLFNPARDFFEKSTTTRPPARRRSDKPWGAEYLIIYGEKFELAARKLAEWKEKQGLKTRVAPIGDIVGPDEEDAVKVKKIKAYIREKRGTPFSPLRYVLLFASVDEIPPEKKRDGVEKITDYYYFTHRDARGAECLLPWISGGRIPSRNEKEGLRVVERIIRWEKEPPRNPDYYRRITVSACFQGLNQLGEKGGKDNKAFIKTMERIKEHMTSQGFRVNRVYVSDTPNPSLYCDDTPVPDQVKEAMIDVKDVATKKLIRLIDEGQLIVGHRGHGTKYGWTSPPFKWNHLKSLSTRAPSVVFSVNCYTGSFHRKEPCFAEKLLAMNGGALSLIASTGMSGAWRNDSMIIALFDAIWPGVIPTFPATNQGRPVKHGRIGDILNYAKAYLLAAHGVNSGTRDHLEFFHVIGDPTLRIGGRA